MLTEIQVKKCGSELVLNLLFGSLGQVVFSDCSPAAVVEQIENSPIDEYLTGENYEQIYSALEEVYFQ